MKEQILNLFLKKWQYKLLAILAAFIIWFYIVNEQNLSFSMSAPVEYANFPANMKLVNMPPSSLEIALEGRKDILGNMKRSEIRVIVDVSKAKEGMNNYGITAANVINLPGGVLIKDITPAAVNMEFQRPKPVVTEAAPAEGVKINSDTGVQEERNGKTVR